MDASPKKKLGRPTRTESELRRLALLECAFEQFLALGFAATTIDGIAEKMQMTKRTIYKLYPNKDVLFRASVAHASSKIGISAEQYQAAAGDSLAETLFNLASLRVDLYLQSGGMALRQILQAEAARFPDLVAVNFRHDPLKARQFLIEQLEYYQGIGEIKLDDSYVAAELFLGMSVGATIAAVTAGELKKDDALIMQRINMAVDIFMNGVTLK